MKEFLKSNIDERPSMIILGILSLYFLITGFILYLYFLHRIPTIPAVISILAISIIYIPRFLIIKKLNNKDKIEIIDNYIMINGVGINFDDISDFQVKEKKPQVVFFINNKMIVFKEATFYLRLEKEQISFSVIGTEKIRLLNELLHKVVNKKY